MMNWRSHSFLFLASFIWGFSNVSQQNILHFLGPITTVGLRCLLASIVVLPFAWNTRNSLPRIHRSGKLLAIVTAVSFGVAVCLAQIGIGYTTVINTSFFINTWTVMTPICIWILQRAKPAKFTLFAASITLVGTFLMAGGTLSALTIGDVLCLLAAFVYSIWAICLTEFVRKFGGALLISLFQFVVTSVLCLAFGLSTEPFSLESLPNAIPDLLILGVFSTGFGYVLQAMAQTKVSASVSAVILSMEAIFGALGGILFLGENMTTLSFLGAALIFGGVVLIQATCESELPIRQKAFAEARQPQLI
jgi:drug/metabolite transporter (DMT)-like permease